MRFHALSCPWINPVLLLGLTASPAAAATVQSFDDAGSAHVLTQHAASPPPTVTAGGPTGNFLRLATNATIPQNNSIAFVRTDPGAFCDIVAEFDLRMTPVVGRADGMGFALLNTANWGTGGAVPPQAPWFVAEEPNFAGSVGVGFDLYKSNDLGDLDNNHVSVHFNGSRVQDFNAGSINLGSGSFFHVRIEIHAGDTTPNVDVVLTPAGGSPVALVTDLPVPGLKPYEGRVWIGGRSGGESAHHDLDNVQVTFTGCPSVLGQWGNVFPLQVVAIHAHLLPTGKVLYWDRHDYGDGTPRLWAPETGTITLVPEPGHDYDIFCSGHSYLKNGDLLVTGGHIADNVGLASASTYNPFTNAWTRHPDMNAGRWYPTNTTLANGDVLTVSGDIDPDAVNPLPQVFDSTLHTWRNLTSAERVLPLYPFMYLAPNGQVFTAGPQPVTSYLETSGTGAWTDVAVSANGHREYGSSVLYDTGKILITGGSPPDHVTPTTASAEIIDLGAASPAWTATNPMAYARRQHTATLLPDGTVLVTGGTSATGFNNSTGAVLPAELWDPSTGAWRTLAGMQVPRLYHSIALLLPDGRVLSAGGGHPSDGANGDPDHPDAEIYSPPYLFKGARPSITSAPVAVPYGQPFFVGTPDAASIAGVTLLRLSSVTHGFNQEQRILRPGFVATAGGLIVTAPSSPNLCPPGYYLLFLLNGSGVPSIGRMLQVEPGLAGADLGLHTLTPCRLVDTRNPDGPLGGPSLPPSSQRTLALTGTCGVPASARALSINVSVIDPAAAGNLTIYPSDRPAPVASSINFAAGVSRANNALVPLSTDGTDAITVKVNSLGTLDLVVDVNGYFE